MLRCAKQRRDPKSVVNDDAPTDSEHQEENAMSTSFDEISDVVKERSMNRPDRHVEGTPTHNEPRPGNLDGSTSKEHQWGSEDTMMRIIKTVKEGTPCTFPNLLNQCPPTAGGSRHSKMEAARCFVSILKLKSQGFIEVSKDPNTFEIKEITLGPRLQKKE